MKWIKYVGAQEYYDEDFGYIVALVVKDRVWRGAGYKTVYNWHMIDDPTSGGVEDYLSVAKRCVKDYVKAYGVE